MECQLKQGTATRREEGKYQRREELYSSLWTPIGRERMREEYPLTCAVDDLVIAELFLNKYIEPERVSGCLEDFVRGEVGAELTLDLRSSPIMVSGRYDEASQLWCVRALIYHGGHDGFVQQLHVALAEFFVVWCRGRCETIVSCEVKRLEFKEEEEDDLGEMCREWETTKE